MQIITKVPSVIKKGDQIMKGEKKDYALLDIIPGVSLNLGTWNAPKWYGYKIVKTFKSEKEAKEYAKENKIEITTRAFFD
ncbi:hypothetical protein J4450_05200 [Candidatus Micrarchaeota archaeon]|nr:hypothetical protein [Candidatus Micrarchaeota archaeon]